MKSGPRVTQPKQDPRRRGTLKYDRLFIDKLSCRVVDGLDGVRLDAAYKLIRMRALLRILDNMVLRTYRNCYVPKLVTFVAGTEIRHQQRAGFAFCVPMFKQSGLLWCALCPHFV